MHRRQYLAVLGGAAFAGCTSVDSGGVPRTSVPDKTASDAPRTATSGEKLLPSGGDEGDLFGATVDIAGDAAVIGAPEDEEKGAAYVFERGSDGWEERTTFGGNEGKDSSFGISVALDDETAIVGDQNGVPPSQTPVPDDPDGISTGLAYVFERENGEWSRTATLLATDRGSGDHFGSSVALGTDIALVGAVRLGAAYVFERTETEWTQQAKLIPADGGAGRFGESVALADDRALVGAPGERVPNDETGAAHVFERTDTGWTQQAKLVPPDGDAGDQFGDSVALAGETALVGAVGEDPPRKTGITPGATPRKTGIAPGAAYVFERGGGRWTQTDRLASPTYDDDGMDGPFGFSVDLAGDTAVVGVPHAERNKELVGAAYVFRRTGTAWAHRETLVASDGDSDDRFGWSVGLKAGTALVGALLDEDPNGKRAGSAYVFEL